MKLFDRGDAVILHSKMKQVTFLSFASFTPLYYLLQRPLLDGLWVFNIPTDTSSQCAPDLFQFNVRGVCRIWS